MEQKSFRLNWKTFEFHLKSSFQDLITEGNFSDVTLVSDDQKQMQAHKFVLSACSPVLKNLLLNNPHSHPLLYLRGVKHQELQSILEFIYLGETRIHEDRINEFIEIAKDLQLKELTTGSPTDESIPKKSKEYLDSENLGINFKTKENTSPDNKTKSVKTEEDDQYYDDDTEPISICIVEPGLETPKCKAELDNQEPEKQLKCKECDSVFKTKSGLLAHNRTKHEGLRYHCMQCDYQATQQVLLKSHTQSAHEGIRYSCNQCGHQAKRKEHLKQHKQAAHDGIRYSCSLLWSDCDYQATSPSGLRLHQQTMHECVRYSCDQCEYQGTRKTNLARHKESKH